MDIATRIAQFENMTQSDPSNEMAHFSLGSAYVQAGRYADAAEAYLKCVGLNNAMSKAYQLAGECLIKAGDNRKATSVLMQGFIIASQKGDHMPKKAMGDLLRALGETPPELAPEIADAATDETDTGPVPPGKIRCRRTGKVGARFERPPFRGRVGAWIGANISKETFELWVRQGTKVINEMRLDLSREKDSETYDQHMYDFLGIEGDLLRELTSPLPA
ncbi:MAG: Fe(2+)-trafficking protein [Phycisphaerales bacterium]